MIVSDKIGYYLSGAGHIGLIGWALFGGLFSSEPLEFEVTEVTTISSQEFAALYAPSDSPDAASDIVTPDAPEVEDALPDVAATQDTPVETAQPDVAEAVEPDVVPEVIPEILPDAEVSDDPPVLEAPAPQETAALPNPDVRPQPRQAPRVAPDPVAQPDPDVRIDDTVQQETTPAENAEVVQEQQEATSPEEATTEIVTEADQAAAAAPSRSVRPQTRPQRTAQTQAETPTETAAQAETPTEQDTSPSTDAVNDALAEALGTGGTDTNPEPTGPPLTGGEKDALVVSVERCWNVGSLSSDALRTTVVISVDMNQDSTPEIGSIRLVDSSGGSGSAVDQAFEAGRRAIIRCGSTGFDLPVEKYDRWRNIEMVFNPEKMRIK